MYKLTVEIRFYVVREEHGSRQVGPMLGMVSMIVSNDDATLASILNVSENIRTKSLQYRDSIWARLRWSNE